MDKPLIIYHFPCHDGFAAAYCAWRKFGSDADYYPTNYGKDAPDVRDRNVYILDFSYPKEIMEKIFATANRTVWLDHHKTAFESYLGEVPSNGTFYHDDSIKHIRLDNHRSGAGIAQTFFFPDEVVPSRLILHVEDRDLWKFNYENTKPFCQALAVEPYDFHRWHQLAHLKEVDYLKYVADGNIMLRQFAVLVHSMVDQTRRPCQLTPLHKGFAANIPPAYQSEAGHKLATDSGTFGLIWYMNKNGVINCSLRSNGSYDVSALAKRFGGGGHRNAAGFQLKSFKELERFFVC